MKIAVIGRGRVASHMVKAFAGKAEVVEVNPHSLEELPSDADIALICVSDNAIAEVAAALAAKRVEGIVAHTSGATPMEALSAFPRHGVFYPLQTFSKGRELSYAELPIFIEGSDAATTQLLWQMAELITRDVHGADSVFRKRLHLAAVFACNFTNHLYAIADTLLREDGLDINVLKPLIRETVAKLDDGTPMEMQTGPAVRGDTATMAAHLKLLASHPDYQEIYRLLSSSIRK